MTQGSELAGPELESLVLERQDGPKPDPKLEQDVETNEDLKEQALFDTLAAWPALIVAYSGGVDSAYLAWAATRILGRAALCITADSPSYPERHRALARQIAGDFGLAHEVIHTNEMARPEYRANPANRCYYCKHELYTHLSAIARERGIPTIADGSNADDRGDYRPGRQAAKEFGVVSPLDAVGLTKAEIRALSHRAGLPTWDEPASACLSSRIPYFSEVTDAKLRMIEQAEAVLARAGLPRVPRPSPRRRGTDRPPRDRPRRDAAGARPRRGRGDRRCAARARLSPRDARPARLPPRQSQRRPAPPPRLTWLA